MLYDMYLMKSLYQWCCYQLPHNVFQQNLLLGFCAAADGMDQAIWLLVSDAQSLGMRRHGTDDGRQQPACTL